MSCQNEKILFLQRRGGKNYSKSSEHRKVKPKVGHRFNKFQSVCKTLYLSPILDLYSSNLVSYTISERPVLSMVITMLDKAFKTIPNDTNLILHSDQGWHYLHKQYRRMLHKKGI